MSELVILPHGLVAQYEESGFHCAIVRHGSLGHLCGYVGVDQGHPWFGKFYDDIDTSVHGGLTFCGSERHGSPEEKKMLRALATKSEGVLRSGNHWKGFLDAIKSKPRESFGCYPCDSGDIDRWWVGFDCAHYGDSVPGASAGGIYRDEAFVRGEISDLVRQAEAAAKEVSV